MTLVRFVLIERTGTVDLLSPPHPLVHSTSPFFVAGSERDCLLGKVKDGFVEERGFTCVLQRLAKSRGCGCTGDREMVGHLQDQSFEGLRIDAVLNPAPRHEVADGSFG